MKYETANAFRTALENRLLARATSDNIPLIRLRKLVVFDRLIARLMIVGPDRWVLKGAVALQFRAGPGYRTTKDIDFGQLGNEEAATSDLLAVQSVDLGDHFSFAIEREGPIDLGDAGGSAVRYHARAELAGRLFESFVLDVAFGEHDESVELLQGPDLLRFADISPARLPVVSLEKHIAEKIHAYVSLYGGGRRSSRVKDLVDLAMIESLFEVEADRLADALAETFSERDGEPPNALPQPPADWRVPYRKLANEVGLEPEISGAYELVRKWIDPILSGIVERGAVWDSAGHAWRSANRSKA